MSSRLLFALLFVGGPAAGDPSFSFTGPATIQVCWPAECGKQYGLFCSPDLEHWGLLGDRIPGVDGVLTAEDDITGTPRKFYRVDVFADFILDLLRLKFGTVGNRWIYNVAKDSGLGLGVENFTWETEIEQRTVFNGENVIEWLFNRDGFWDQSIYLLDDFSTGIYEVGGVVPTEGSQAHTPPLPSLLGTFTPGETVAVDYTTVTTLGSKSTSEDITITIEKDLLSVEAGSFAGLIKVTRESEGSLVGIPTFGSITEWYALDVGLVKHVGEVIVLGTSATTTFELKSYDVE